ncbi:MAG: M13 family metallopeptidase [Dysgonamonadaceae bacterium]|nr:M13 family metallopeptidase [Dysgonamonadaceae bacterium]MDD3310032.1 M13 family metallopeptidase [Dysgonamonadaceae bacterium]MDD3901533.1 M13 family metallopeptidase [Dysgonamonadaceae bacterium]MDD4399574.1 M13 family metallopeptidase [Dysgonamonadaceae bacterium]
MKKLLFIASIIGIMTMTSCSEKGQKKQNNLQDNINVTNLDSTVNPGNDFYQFATGGWQKLNPIPDEYARYGSFDKLREENQKQIQELIEELGKAEHKAGTNAQKIGDLYKSGMDSVKLNADGAAPIQSKLQKISSTKDKKQLIGLMAEVSKSAPSPFFNFYVTADDKDASMNIAHFMQGGIGMGDRDYYLEDQTSELRDKYVQLIETQFKNAGYTEADAKEAAVNVLRIESALAAGNITKEMLRKPELNYHKMAVADLDKEVAPFEWVYFLDQLGAKNLDSINVAQVSPLKNAVAIFDKESVSNLQDYLSWKVIDGAANFLSDDFVNANFDFYGKAMSGRKELQPRWRRTVDGVNGALGEAVGQLYVEKYFSAEAKDRMIKLVDNLKLSLSERINNLEWMSDETKAKAQEKLSTFIVKVGYPDKWKDYSSLEINDDSYYANMVRAQEFAFADMMKDLGKPVDNTKWYMTPQTVNAYYNPSTNEICFPAGILQSPFFYMNGDDAINYGGIGVVIGHEMTHGFDDQGRKYDKDGNLTDWWTKEDATRFDDRAKVMVDYFDNIVVIDSINANGTFTLGENIADHGGLQVAYNAFLKTDQAKSTEKKDGFTPAQRFFLSYANLWAGNVRDEEVKRLTKIDPHSLGRWRVNGALPHIDAWYEAFDVQSTDSMYLPKEERVSIW